MARKYGKIVSTAWIDPGFLALSNEAKLLMIAFVSQPDISAAGILTFAERRWRRWLGGMDATLALNELVAANMVDIDEDTVEIWVRAFMKHDARIGHKKLGPTVIADIEAIASDRLRERAWNAYHGRPDTGSDSQSKPPRDSQSDCHRDSQSKHDRNGYPDQAVHEDENEDETARARKPITYKGRGTDDVVAEVIEYAVERKIREGGDRIHNPEGFRKSMPSKLRGDYETRINAYVAEHPHQLDPEQRDLGIIADRVGLVKLDKHEVIENLGQLMPRSAVS